MLLFVLRRIGWAALTIFGVMLFTFVLFRWFVAGDIAGANVGMKAPEQDKAAWRHRHGYDKPMLLNVHRQLTIFDKTQGDKPFMISDPAGSGSLAANSLALVLENPPEEEEGSATSAGEQANEQTRGAVEIRGRYLYGLDRDTPLDKLAAGMAVVEKASPRTPHPKPTIKVELSNGETFNVDLTGVRTAGELIDRINKSPENKGRLVAGITGYSAGQVWDSQFFHHLKDSLTFESRSFKDNRKLLETIAEKGPYSLSIMVPAEAFEFMLGLAVALLVAYYRGRRLDKIGVFLSVLGMCIPFLAFMIYGQGLMFMIAPKHAYGVFYRANIFLPIAIMVIAGLGGTVRFYRTIILDETNRDYVRTARAKGLPLTAVLFKHVLKNCMLPILTSMILSIPFLIMGSLLVETYFGIPGLGDLLVSSIWNRDEPIMSGLVFLTALVLTLGMLITDLCYALFDPRIKLA
jgi:peptide/nickel transport system permease protein